MKLAEATRLLGIGAQPTAIEVRQAWRRAAGAAHPDAGGELVAFLKLKLAYEVALAWAQQPVTCSLCEGKGEVPGPRGRSLAVRWIECPKCQGSGKTSQKSLS